MTEPAWTAFERMGRWFASEPLHAEITPVDLELAADVRYVQPLLMLLPVLTHAQHILEIGVADGSTTIPLLWAASLVHGHVTSVDPDSCRVAYDLVRRTHLGAHWTMRHKKSVDVLAAWDGPLDFAYVDGDHSYQGVFGDLSAILPRLTPGGFVVAHEWSDWPARPGEIPRTDSAASCQAAAARAVQDALAACDPDEYGLVGLHPKIMGPSEPWPGIGCAIIQRRPAIEVEFRRRYREGKRA